MGLALLWGLLISLAQVVGVFQDFDQPLLDLRQSLPTEVPLVENDLALVEINEIPAARGWPWPRLDYAILLRSLLPYNPQGIVFEMLLHERDTQYSAFDARFAGTVRNMNEVVFAAAGLSAKEDQPVPNNLDSIPATNVDPYEMAQYHSLLWPLPAFAENSRVGLNNLLPPSSQQPRRIPLVFWYNGQIVPSLALQAAGSRLNISWALSEVVMGDAIYMRDGNGVLQRTVPIDQEGRLFMRYRPNFPASWTATFDNVPLYARVAETGGEPEQNLREVKDRLVFVGRTDTPTFKAIPGLVHPTSNVQVQMLATRNILNADYIYEFPGWLIIPIYLFVAASAGLFFFYYGPGPGLFLLAILFGSWMETAILAFRGYSFDMPMVSFGVLLLGLIPISFAAAHWGMRPVTRTPRPSTSRTAMPEKEPAVTLANDPTPSYVQQTPVEVQQLGMGFEEETTQPAPTTTSPAQEVVPVVNEQGVTTLPLSGQTSPEPQPQPEPVEEDVPEPDPDDFEKALARLAEIHEHIELEEQAEQERQERERQEKELRAAREQLEAERRKREEERQRREAKRQHAIESAKKEKAAQEQKAATAKAKSSSPKAGEKAASALETKSKDKSPESDQAKEKKDEKSTSTAEAKNKDASTSKETDQGKPDKTDDKKNAPTPEKSDKSDKVEDKTISSESKKGEPAPKNAPPEKTAPHGKPVEKADSPVKPQAVNSDKKDEPAKPVSVNKDDSKKTD